MTISRTDTVTVVVLFFLVVRVPSTPRSAFILPPPMLACTYCLNRNRNRERRPDLVDTFVGHIRPCNCLLLFIIPVTAIAIYAPVAVWQWKLSTNWLLYVITMPLGFFFLARSLWILLRSQDGQDDRRIEPGAGRQPVAPGAGAGGAGGRGGRSHYQAAGRAQSFPGIQL